MTKPVKISKSHKKSLLRKSHFRFGSRSALRANILLRSTRSNIFITLTDLKKKVIICKSAGSVGVGTTKKKKISPYVIETILKFMVPYLHLYGIKKLNVIFKTYTPALFPFLLKALHARGFIILRALDRCCVPHNGVRIRKSPRK